MSDNDGGDGIELRNMNGKNAAEAVSIAKGQKLRIEDGYRFHGSNTLVALDPDQKLEKSEALNMQGPIRKQGTLQPAGRPRLGGK